MYKKYKVDRPDEYFEGKVLLEHTFLVFSYFCYKIILTEPFQYLNYMSTKIYFYGIRIIRSKIVNFTSKINHIMNKTKDLCNPRYYS